MVERVARAARDAARDRAFGLYDYSSYPGDAPPHVVKNDRTGATVFRSNYRREAEDRYDKEVLGYIGGTIIEAMREPTATMKDEIIQLACEFCHGDISEVELWSAMVDAALSGG